LPLALSKISIRQTIERVVNYEQLNFKCGRSIFMKPTNHNLRINADRLWDSILEMAKIGATAGGGSNRQALTKEDAQGRLLFKKWCESASLNVSIDRVGSMFARREGRESLPPILVGSHLDTQPTGGKFDGVLGVLAGLEVIRILDESGISTKRPIEVVNWTNEEGCRFAPAMLASAAFTGVISAQAALDTRDADGIRFGDELAKMNLDCSSALGGRSIAAYVELHIEQGPILEAESYDIGFVAIGQGHRWYDVNIKGFESHTGSTPMSHRRDALLGAAKLIEAVNAIGRHYAPDGVASVASMRVLPNSRNVIAGEVLLSIDVRHPKQEMLDAMDKDVREAYVASLVAAGLEGTITDVSNCPPVPFDHNILGIIREEANHLGLKGRDIISGAGHDAFHLARVAPTAMIFTPCRDGISHNEAEDITQKWAANGANLLLRTVMRLANEI
jgi:beta-ureidopropionase / N-carbamoyl-L-amino-acid hydrolase